ncbi:helix-turn-helix domain-containing protein [Butyrivibrio sp. VCB2001]|uniref:helix-turn-helix domain-containing protein n=1 Tax=Butyrivibrio sp. VCB2001 TaxID=1280667 RepID=UPI00041A74D9|nr:helix-turn-helix domain-containing protein [Butyrivibrio sp. VCB2001]
MSASVRELRVNSGMSQREFAENFNIPLSTLRKWEHGDAKPADYVVELIARQLPGRNKDFLRIDCDDGKCYFIDRVGRAVEDQKGNRIAVRESFEGVKHENLKVYVEELFEAFYQAQNQFDRDLYHDRKYDALWIKKG